MRSFVALAGEDSDRTLAVVVESHGDRFAGLRKVPNIPYARARARA